MTNPEKQQSERRAPRLALLACSVFEREIALWARGATHIAEVRYFEMGLHDRPDQIRVQLQERLDEMDAREDIEAILLAYGLCGRGTVKLRSLRHKLVIPRAHDCITVFMGSKEAYAEHQRRCPTCFYYTPGWNRDRRVPGPERLEAMKLELAAKFDPDDVEFLIETERNQWGAHDTVTYIELGTDDAKSEAEYSRMSADWLNWKFEYLEGNPSLLRDLLWGDWDIERFQIIEPGMQLGQAPDETIMRSELISPKTSNI